MSNKLKIAIDIDGVVQAIGHIPDKPKRLFAFAHAPMLGGLVPEVLADWQKKYDPFFVTGRSRTSAWITTKWMKAQGIPALPTYFVDSQRVKPEFLRLLEADVVIDDNPNVLRACWVAGWAKKLILVNDPNFHNWEMPWKQGIPNYITVVRNLAEAAAVVGEAAHQAAALSDLPTA